MSDRETVLDVYLPGVDVEIHNKTPGIITKVCIEPRGLATYCVRFFINGEYKSEWFYEHELVPSQYSTKHLIGFRGGDV